MQTYDVLARQAFESARALLVTLDDWGELDPTRAWSNCQEAEQILINTIKDFSPHLLAHRPALEKRLWVALFATARTIMNILQTAIAVGSYNPVTAQQMLRTCYTDAINAFACTVQVIERYKEYDI